MVVLDASGLLSGRGISSYIESLVQGLASECSQAERDLVTILAPFEAKSFLEKISGSKAIDIVYKPYFNQIVWELVQVPFYAYRLNAKALHYTGNTGGTILPRIFRIKIIATIHDVSFLKSAAIVPKPSLFRQKIGYYYRRINTPKVASMANCIITVSNFAKKDIVDELRCDPDKVYVVFNSLRKIFGREGKRVEKEKIILIVSGDGAQKNLDPTLKCLLKNREKLSGWRIYVIGKSAPSNDFIEYKGMLDSNRMVDYYDMSTVLLMPSLYESFSIPIVEALSRGLTVIASNRGAAPEILKSFGYLYSPLSCNDLTNSFDNYFSENSASKREQIQYARAFSIKRQIQNTLLVYNKVITG